MKHLRISNEYRLTNRSSHPLSTHTTTVRPTQNSTEIDEKYEIQQDFSEFDERC